MQIKEINNKQIAIYGLMAFPLAFLTIPIYIYLPNYYANNFAISLKTIGLVLLLSRFLDALLDPLIGFCGDKYYQFKKIFIVGASLLSGIVFVILFNLPIEQNFAFWLFVILLINYFLFSLIQINYQSLAVDLSEEESTKNKIIIIRESCGVLGIIVASILPSLLNLYLQETTSFLVLGIFYFLVITSCAALFYKIVPNYSLNLASSAEGFNLKSRGKFDLSFLGNSKLKYFLAILFFNSCAFGITASLMLFFVEKILQGKNLVGLFLALYFGGLLLGIPFWSKIAQKLKSKERAWLWAMSLIVLIFIGCAFLKAGDFFYYGLICLFSGFCFAADYCLSYLILTDLIQGQNLQKNQSAIFGINNFLIKFCFAIISGLMIFLLGLVQGFGDANLEHNFLIFAYCLLPCFLKIFTSLILKKAQKLC